MQNEKWLTALHESGHAVSALAQGGEVGYVAIADGGICLAQCRDETAQAFMVAAGPVAEQMLSDVPPPPEERPHKRASPIPEAEEDEDRTATAQRVTSRGSRHPSDARQLAEWAISGRENEPASWAGRIAWVHTVAHKIVNDNRAEILRLATALYHRQLLFTEEIQSIFKGE